MATSNESTVPHFALEPAADRKLTLRLRGDIDVTNVGDIEAALRQATEEGLPELVLDLSQATFMDSAGIRLVLQADRWQRRAGNSLVVVPGEGAVERVLQVSGLALMLNLECSQAPGDRHDINHHVRTPTRRS